MIRAVEHAMEINLGKLTWMDEPTKKRALEKLHAIANKIGYPDVWRKYDGLTIARSEHFENMSRAQAFEVKRRLAKIGQPVDRNEWLMTPPEVNAYYDSSMNEMVFPAGILQPPFYSARFPSSVNFGGIGMVMGHELTHGFDDEGRKFDAKGNVTDWWTPASSNEFKQRADCVDKQYSDYVAIDELHVDGKLTMGENIADLGGMKLAYAAWKELGGASAAPPEAAGFNAEQQFFLGYAQGWCGNLRREAARRRATDDFHSPPKWRVNGVVSNMPEFAKAFSCKDGAPMARGEGKRCEVW
jgi:endothelin-converting enzyme/putative endopeptidase